MDEFKSLYKVQMDHFIDTYEELKGDKVDVAKALNWSVKTVYNWVEKSRSENRKICLHAKRATPYKLETMLEKTLGHIILALESARGNRTEAAKLLEINKRTIYNYMAMAEFEKIDCPYIGYRKEKELSKPIFKPVPQSIDDFYHPMPTNEERLFYLDNSEAKSYNKLSFQGE